MRRFLKTLILTYIGGILIMNTIQSSDWPMFLSNPQHTGFSDSYAPDSAHLLWIYDTQGEIFSSPIIVKGHAFLASNDTVFSLDSNKGNEIWKISLSVKHSTPVVTEDRLYVATNEGIVAVNSNNGEIIWKYIISGRFVEEKYFKLSYYISSSPVISIDTLCIGTSSFDTSRIHPPLKDRDEYYIVCLNKNNGKEIWSFNAKNDVKTSPAFNNGRVYAAVSNGTIYSINLKSGQEIWRSQLGSGYFDSSPVVSNGKIFIGLIISGRYSVLSIDEYSGEKLWESIVDAAISSSITVGYGKVFFSTIDGKIYALDEFSGNKMWEFETEINQKKYSPYEFFWSSPAVADSKIFVGMFDGNFYCLDAETGKLIWKYKTGGPIYSSPAISDGKVFIASTDGKLYAFGIDPEMYYSKAEKYFSEKQYERAKEFYLKAKDYYTDKGNIEMIKTIENKIVITEQKISEDKPRQEDLVKAQKLIEEGSSDLVNEKFKDALASFKEAKLLYEKYGEKYKIRLCEDRISYAEKRIKEQTTNGFIILGVILLIPIAGFLIIRKLKKKITT